MEKLISIIIPIYKVEEYLDDCIESVVAQSYTNLEIILINDGSPDKCPEMCDSWKKKDKRIKVIHKENGGLSSARNAGLDICTGEYIMFVDSDDFIHKNMVEELFNTAEKEDADIVKSDRYIIKDNKIEHVPHIGMDKTYSREEMLNNYFYNKDDFLSGIWDKIFRRELFENIRFPHGLNSEDYYVYVMLFSMIKKMCYINKPLYYYRIRENSICTTKTIDKHAYDKIIVSDKVAEYVEKNLKEYIDDAKIFQSWIRYSEYLRLMEMEHSIEDEKKWQADIRKYSKCVIKNKNVEFLFKIKYVLEHLNLKTYYRIKKII